MLEKLTIVVLVTVLCVVGCGGGAPPANTTPPPANSQASTTPANSGSPAADPAARMEAQRDDFIAHCMGKTQATEYCKCGFEQFKEVFKNADLDAKPSEALLETLKQKTLAACADKLPEAPIKAGFVSSCNGTDARKNAYCECAWTSLRKTMSLGDFAAGLTGAHFEDAKKRMVGECKGKLPDEAIKGEFVGECAKDGSISPKGCECMWKKVRAKFTSEEIAAGVADVKTVQGLADCKK